MVAELDRFERALAGGGKDDKVAALKGMRDRVADGQPAEYFDLAKKYIGDRDTDVRWQALIVIGEYIPSGRRNEEIWNVIEEFTGVDDDMRDALATVLLEHLLEYDFDRTLERIKAAFGRKTEPLIGVAKRCWRLGQAEGKWNELERLVES